MVTAFVQKLAKQSLQNGDKYSFISRPSASFTPVELNQYVLRIMGDKELTKDQKVGLRNYFVQNAALSRDVHQALTSLRGL